MLPIKVIIAGDFYLTQQDCACCSWSDRHWLHKSAYGE